MEPIKITQKLTANPGNIDLPDPGKTTLTFEASGPGEVEIHYSLSPEKSIRFLEGSEPKTVLFDTTVLSSNPKAIVKGVKFRLVKEGKPTESFVITAVVRKKAADGSIADYSRTTDICTYFTAKAK